MLTSVLLGVLSGGVEPIAVSAPTVAAEPLTLDEVRQNLRQPPAQQNDRLTALIVTAREFVEDQTGLVLTRRTVTETARQLGPWVDLDSWPVVKVTAIRYPVGPVLVDLVAGSWACGVARRPVRLFPVQPGWGVSRVFGAPPMPIEIDVLAGYASPADVPMRVKQAMHMLVAHWFANPDAVLTGQRAAAIEVPMGVVDLLRGLRLVRV